VIGGLRSMKALKTAGWYFYATLVTILTLGVFIRFHLITVRKRTLGVRGRSSRLYSRPAGRRVPDREHVARQEAVPCQSHSLRTDRAAESKAGVQWRQKRRAQNLADQNRSEIHQQASQSVTESQAARHENRDYTLIPTDERLFLTAHF
jgi:hypothetical protein